MRQKSIMIGVLALFIIVLAGCSASRFINSEPVTGQTINEPDFDMHPSIDPRFDALIAKAEQLDTFRYNLSDTALNHKWYYFQSGRVVRILLNDVKTLDDGTVYDEVFLDRVEGTAFTHCSAETCGAPKDYELEPSEDYDLYYEFSPRERLYQVKEAEFLREDTYGAHDVDVFRFKNNDLETGTIYIQPYYGVPLKIEYDSGREIVFENLQWNNMRFFNIMLPFNYSIRGQEVPIELRYGRRLV